MRDVCKRGHLRTPENLKGTNCKLCIKLLRKEAPESHRLYQDRYRKRHPDRVLMYFRKWKLKKNFDITPELYGQLFNKQLGLCAICGEQQLNKKLAVDHDHQTGQVRGLLCTACNIALGLLHDDPVRLVMARQYLKQIYKGDVLGRST